jgi:hypothetical protein
MALPDTPDVSRFFTKLLQGLMFYKFCNVVLGYKHITTLATFTLPVAQEHVGE